MSPQGIGIALLHAIAHRVNRALTATAPDKHLGHHHRHTNQQNTSQIDQHKGATAVTAGNIGKFPHIAQSHGRPGRSHNKSPATRPGAVHAFLL